MLQLGRSSVLSSPDVAIWQNLWICMSCELHLNNSPMEHDICLIWRCGDIEDDSLAL